ncbi:MAG: GNAT family N-acetyltransferase [Actinocatenispora sp.]
MQIRSFDRSTDIDGWLAVAGAATAVDAPDLPTPCRDAFVGGLDVPWPGERDEHRVVEVDGRIVGILRLGFMELDNEDNVEMELAVHPEFRRRGIGTRLHAVAVDEARRAGRRRLMSDSVRALPGRTDRPGAGSLFAPTTGAQLGQTEIRRVLDTTGVDRAAIDARIAELRARATGYTMVSWAGDNPDDIVAGIAKLDSSFLGEAPLGDLRWEPQRVDVPRVREVERSRRARRSVAYQAVARHDATGEIVAWTEITDHHCPDWYAEQDITLVTSAHRGHRLGLLTKLVNLAQVLDSAPAVTVIDTSNAEENEHMIAINEAMGFRAVDAWDAWQLDL